MVNLNAVALFSGIMAVVNLAGLVIGYYGEKACRKAGNKIRERKEKKRKNKDK